MKTVLYIVDIVFNNLTSFRKEYEGYEGEMRFRKMISEVNEESRKMRSEANEELGIKDEDIKIIKDNIVDEFKDIKREWFIEKDIDQYVKGGILCFIITRGVVSIYFISNTIKLGSDWSALFLIGFFMQYLLYTYVVRVHEKLHIFGMTTKNNRNDFDIIMLEENKYDNLLSKKLGGTINAKGWVKIGRNKYLIGLLLPCIVLTLIPFLICFSFYNVALCVVISGFAVAHSWRLTVDLNNSYNLFKNTNSEDILLVGPNKFIKGHVAKIRKYFIKI